MKKRAIVIGILAATLVSSWVAAQGGPGNPTKGQALYGQHCVRCHGVSGDGTGPDGRFLVVAPTNFRSRQFQLKTDLEILMSISHGVAYSPMHAWRGRLTDEEMRGLISYLRMLSSFGPIS